MGLDGMAFDDDADALREARLLWRHQCGIELEPTLSHTDLAEAIFVNGRRTITPVAGGAVEMGLAADLMVLDYGQMAADLLTDNADEFDLMLSRGRKEHVRGLIVGGRTIVEKGKLASIDLAAAEAELLAQARAGWAAAQAVDDVRRRHRDALANFYAQKRHSSPEE